MTTRPRPGGAPAYYLARPAAFWLAAFRRQPANVTSPAEPACEQLTR
jgi:hypothetical protein